MSAGNAMLDDFLGGRLDPAAFRHEDHVRVAFDILAGHPFFDAAARYEGALKHLTEKAGKADKYSATITFAFLSRIAERMHRGDWRDASQFLRDNPDLLEIKSVLSAYEAGRLGSDVARAVPLLP